MKKILKVGGAIFLVLLLGLFIWMFTNLKDRHSGYSADLKVANSPEKQLQAGFAAVAITPEVPDRWEDKNGDAKYKPKDGDTFTDGNGNGVFDPVWIAGFSNSKPANGIHDDTWARTMIIDDGTTRLAMVMIDAIGFMHDDVVDVREMIPAEAGITYAIVASTHTHESADLLGMWGKTPFKSGINKDYMKFVKNQIVKSIVEAAENLRPASLEISQDLTGAIPLVKDTRKPEVFDSGLRMIKASDKENGNTLGAVVAWETIPKHFGARTCLFLRTSRILCATGLKMAYLMATAL